VTCYTRHLKDLLPETPNADDRRALDRTIRAVLSLPATAGCPEVWAAVKAADRDDLATRVRAEL
jgi:hypothetical protein